MPRQHVALRTSYMAAPPVGPWFADFVCRERKLMIELDGFSHDVQTNRDVQHNAWLKRAGYRVLHFTNADMLGK